MFKYFHLTYDFFNENLMFTAAFYKGDETYETLDLTNNKLELKQKNTLD